MSTQDHGGVAFGIAHDQQAFRLLELPAELLDIISAPNPPRLSVKSTQTSESSQGAKPPYAVLCAPNKTYQIRQVQTSNSVFVAQTYTEADSLGYPADGINAIASCTATLELHPVTESAVYYLKTALDIWDGDSTQSTTSTKAQSKAAVINDIPLSDGECETSWTQICAFEADGNCFQPTNHALQSSWRDIVEAAVAESIGLSEMFLIDEVWRAVDSQTMGSMPRSLLEAILRRLLPDDESFEEGWARTDQSRTVQWTGSIILQAQGAESRLTADFMDLWRNSLPEKWRETAQLEAIQGLYTLPTSTTITWSGSSGNNASGSTPSKVAAQSGGNARKWHERFRNARK